ncbi:MAG: PBP1A family penicillin-binding protein [Patescibacteria group bacterium]
MKKLISFKNKIKILHFSPKILKKRKITWKKVGQYFFVFFIAMLLLTGGAFAWFSKDLPTPTKIANRKATESTKLFDKTGKILLYETGEQKRTLVTSDQVSQYLKDATISTEDANFYDHHGVDPKAIAAAVIEKVTGKRVLTRGGSTITQQYVKNALLSSNRTLTRKIKEVILSVELEMMFSKDEILTMYLNEIPYGNNTAGAEAAARMYYGVPAKDLTLAQAGTLAAIPKAPTYYSPYGVHAKELVNRKNYVLDRMVSAGKISKDEAEKAKQEDTTTIGTALKPRRDNMLAPHFAMYVLEKVADEYGEEKIQKEGLKIITTLDYEMQKKAERAVNDGTAKILKHGGSNAAMVAVDPKTGQILSMVGSRDYFNTEIDGNVNVTDSLRQPGSSFKPFAYATAFKKKEFSPSRIIYDVQTDFNGYIPRNYTHNNFGPVTIRTALSNSLNVPAVKILSLAGMDNTLRTAEDLGITTLTQRKRYGLSLVLGSGEVKPIEMAGAFGVFANGGVKHDINPILKISDSKNKTVYEYNAEKDKGKEVLDPQIAYEISNILSDKITRTMVFGAGTLLNFPNRTVAAKTGTTSDFKDAWTVGYTPSLSVAVWVGNNNAKPMGSAADGSVVATPIFRAFIDKALEGIPSEEFVKPDGIVEMEVEKYSNKKPSQFSKEKTKDIFASWQVPDDTDGVNLQLRFCKGSNKLAPDGFPEALTDTKVISIIHSERPDYPNWENPVVAWAQANGFFTGNIPKDFCNTEEVTPAVSITAPGNNDKISGNYTFKISINNSINITSAEYFVDSVSVGRSESSPFSLVYDTGSLSTSSAHKLTVIVTSEFGVTNKNEISFYIDTDTTVPTISNIVSVPLSNSATISWSTDENATSQVFYDIISRSDTSNYISKTAQSTVYTKNHNATLTTLSPSTQYYYRVVSIDANGNTATSEEKNFTTGS